MPESRIQNSVQKYVTSATSITYWFIFRNSNAQYSTLRKLWSPFLVLGYIIFFSYYIPAILNIYKSWGDIENITGSFFVVLSLTRISCATILFYLRRNTLDKLIFKLENSFDILEKTMNIPDKLNLQNIERSLVKFIRIFLVSSIISCSMLPFIPLFESNCFKPEKIGVHNKPAGTSCARTWYPFDVSSPPLREVILLLETVACCMAAILFPNATTWYISLVYHLIVRCRILQHCVRNVDTKEVEEEMSKAEYSGYFYNKDSKNVHTQDQMRQLRLMKCIMYHQEILRFSVILKEYANPFLLISLLYFTVDLCTICYQMFQAKADSMQFTVFLVLIVISLTDFSSLCWLSSKLSEESGSILGAAYENEWYNGSARYKKLILLMMMKANKPIVLSASNVSPIDMNSIVKVFQTTYSYFTLLRKAENR